jgi:hypothetical protein
MIIKWNFANVEAWRRGDVGTRRWICGEGISRSGLVVNGNISLPFD